jgi:group I intron endonuclease
MAAGIYAITNTTNGKVYIGSTVDFERRWGRHKDDLRLNQHHNLHLQCSWNKYGKDIFEFGILEYLNNLDELHLAEIFWVDIYKEEGRDIYNIATPGKAPTLGLPVSKETRHKISEALKGVPKSEEHRRKLSKANMGKPNGMLGRKHSKESRRRMSAAQMGNTNTLGHKLSEEHKRKLIEANIKLYPAFVNRETGEVIPEGYNLTALCRERNLCPANMWNVAHRNSRSYKGWVLARGLEAQ